MHTRFTLAFCLAATTLAFPSPPEEPCDYGLPSIWKPGVKWQIVIHAPVDITQSVIPLDARVWDIDYFHALDHPDIIPALKSPADGIDNVVLCYVNVGAIESYEDDYPEFPQDALGKSYEDYPEYWVDIRRPDVVQFMKERIIKAAEIGCDGVDADNIDGYDQDEEGVDKTGWNLTRSDVIGYVKSLATLAHNTPTHRGVPLMFGQKNAPHIASDLVSIVDFAVLEDCQGLNGRLPGVHEAYCPEFQAFVTGENRTDGKKLPVFEIEYPGSLEGGSTELTINDWEYYCNRNKTEVGNEGFSLVLKHESGQLDGWGQYCQSEVEMGQVRTATLPI
ncbi:related to endo alpha-1,4 polygalactosaminidase precusor [Cephalotrichum gorgonifer]|uniref:alpha-galactosidase n=1 Tax=Cephalotrichum gorgonifer TaxID=2041049 RepID=A0AAE8MZQ0_9PEZI|nr:related to endo alpha-1,4 polygalactosaminidase precusor [Cephalotrichum gorgonifer]